MRAVYDSPNNRHANVKSIYIFSDQHQFSAEDATFLLLKYGMILLPLFLPTDYMMYAEKQALADVVLTMYSPMLVGLWKLAWKVLSNEPSTSTAVAIENVMPIEIYVQKDCAGLKEIQRRVQSILFTIIDVKSNTNMFKRMHDATVTNVERTGKAMMSMGL